MSYWQPDKCELLEVLYYEGRSGRAIAGVMGITRNSVIGKRHRMGLTKNGNPKHSGPYVSGPGNAVVPLMTREEDRRIASGPDVAGIPRNRQCKWPTTDEKLTPASKTDFGCPNTTKRGQPYCAHHAAIAEGKTGPRTGAPGVSVK